VVPMDSLDYNELRTFCTAVGALFNCTDLYEDICAKRSHIVYRDVDGDIIHIDSSEELMESIRCQFGDTLCYMFTQYDTHSTASATAPRDVQDDDWVVVNETGERKARFTCGPPPTEDSDYCIIDDAQDW